MEIKPWTDTKEPSSKCDKHLKINLCKVWFRILQVQSKGVIGNDHPFSILSFFPIFELPDPNISDAENQHLHCVWLSAIPCFLTLMIWCLDIQVDQCFLAFDR